MDQRVPLDGEIDPFGGEKRHGHVASPFIQLDVADGVSAAQQVNFHLANRAGIHLVSIQRAIDVIADKPRSEEHTSELQSPVHLVCRLLLEKKKQKTQQ